MEEKTEIIPDEENRDTIPENGTVIPVKFNKETRNLTIEEAKNLSQKGLKFDVISTDWERLKKIASLENKSVSEYLDAVLKERTDREIDELTKECGGNRELAQRLVSLEGGRDLSLRGEEDFKEFFPEKDLKDIEEEIIERAKENNSNLLDEYLRFKAKEIISKQREEKQRKENERSAVGSQIDSGLSRTPEAEEFIRGIWK